MHRSLGNFIRNLDSLVEDVRHELLVVVNAEILHRPSFDRKLHIVRVDVRRRNESERLDLSRIRTPVSIFYGGQDRHEGMGSLDGECRGSTFTEHG